MASATSRSLAIVTGASTGIGYELATVCAENGFDLVIAADEPKINQAAQALRTLEAEVEAVEADLATSQGVEKLYDKARSLGRPVDALLANAGRGLSKGFLELRHELKDGGVTVTCLMPGATEHFFERADWLDTKLGTAKKDDPTMVARKGFDAMMKGEGDVVIGWHNKLQAAIALMTPAGWLAEMHRKQAEPGSATAIAASFPLVANDTR